LETEELINKFYLHIREKYPDITSQEINIICRAPFTFLRRQIGKMTLPIIRFKYFGVFQVKKGRLAAYDRNASKVQESVKTPHEQRKVDKMNAIINLNSNKNDD
jgi:hypothetical protein